MKNKAAYSMSTLLRKNKVDAYLAVSAASIFYVTGFVCSATEREAYMVVRGEKVLLVTDLRYRQQALDCQKGRKGLTVEFASRERPVTEIVADFCLGSRSKSTSNHTKEVKIGFESSHLTFDEYEKLNKHEKLHRTLVALPFFFGALRQYKNSEELSYITQAAKGTDECFTAVIDKMSVGMTEKDVVAQIEDWTKQNGYGLAFPPIVATQKNSAEIHYNPQIASATKIVAGDLVLIDMGLSYKGYCADMTRMVYMGGSNELAASKDIENITATYSSLEDSYRAGIASLTLGTPYSEVDAACRKVLQNTSPTLPQYAHATGHGIGLDVHELPHISATSQNKVANGHTITIEPGVYVQNKFGMRLENTVAIVDGKVKTLTKTPLKLHFIPASS